MTSGAADAAAVLHRKAIAIVNVARVIATAHISFRNSRVETKRAESCCMKHWQGIEANLRGKFESFQPAIADRARR